MANVLVQPVNPGIYPHYEALKVGVLAWAQREDLAQHVASFIELAERTMFRELALRADEDALRGTTSGATIALPSVLNAIDRIEIAAHGRLHTLDYTSPNGVELLTGAPGLPTRYIVENGAIRLLAAPSGSYDYTVFYRPTPDFLSPSNQTNALLTAHPDIYLWGALTELARFVMDPELEASYLNAYKSALSSIQRADERRRLPVSGGMQIKPRGRR